MKKLKNKGFTLVELVAIVVILAAIFLVAFPMILSSSKRAENKKYNIMVDILCDAGKSYIYTSGEDFELNNVGDRTTIFIADLVQNGVVDPETKNPRNDSLVIDDRLLFVTNSDKSLSCTFQSLEEIPVPNTRNSCIDNLVYNSNVQYLIKNTNSNVIYTNDRASNAGNHTVTATIDPFSPVIWENRTTDPKTFVCTIARAPLTPTLTCENPKVYDNTRNANCTIGLTNIQGSDTITATATCLYDTKDIGTNKTISCTNITLDGTKSSNYTLTSTSLTTTGVVNNAKLTFNPNGGTLVGTSPLYARKGEVGVFTEIRNSTAGTVPTATKTGHTFKGWYTNTTAIDLVYTSQKQNTSVHRIDIVDGSNGWAMTSSDAGKHIQAKIIVTDSGISNQPTIQFNDIDITPYEVEHTNNTWTFYLDFDITSEMVTDRVYPYSNTYRFIDIEGLSNSSSVTVESLTKDGKKYFDGTGSSVYTSDFVSDTTLYAGWDAKRLTIRYNKNDGSGSISSETFVYDGNMNDNYFNPPSGYNTRPGYKFAGWSMRADGTDDIRWSFNVSIGENWFINQMGTATTKTVDVYAVWTPNVLTVNFYADGAIYNSSGTPVNELLGTDTLYYNGTVDTYYPTDYADPWGYKLVKAGYSAIGRYRIGSADSSNIIVQDLGETTVTGVANRLGVLSQLESGDVTVNLYAGWTEKTYTLAINPNGGSWNSSTSTTTYTKYYSDVTNIPNPTRSNYTFGGWSELSLASFTDTNLNNISVYDNTGNGAVTITGQNKSSDNVLSQMNRELKITNSGASYASPGLGGFYHGKTSAANRVFVHVFVAKLPVGFYFHNANNAIGTGGTTEWLTSNAGTGQFETYVYKVTCGSSGTFSSFGHVYVSPDPRNYWSVRRSEKQAYTAYLAYSNIYDITDNNNGIGQLDGTATLTANWTSIPVYIYYNPNGGTPSGSYTTYNGWVATTSNPSTHFIQTVNPGATTDLYNYGTFGITRTGYTPQSGSEWCTGNDGSGTCFNQDTQYSADTYRNAATLKTTFYDLSLYVNWKINQNTLTVNPNGGTILFNGANRTTATSVTQNYNTTIAVPNPTKDNSSSQISSYAVSFDTHGGNTISAITATKTGTYSYTFSSWSNSSNCGSMSGTTYTFPSSNGTTCTKTANWSSTLVSTSGGTITLPTPSRAGYSFTGWYTAESGGTKIGDAGASYTPTAAITLHAQWASAPTLTYEIYKSDGTTVASTITGTGSVTTAGYRVGSIVKFTCTGTTSNKPQYIKVNGTNVETQSISQYGEVIRTKGYTITSPGPATINAECGNQGGGVATSSTGSKNYYRIFGLSCQRNGATSIGSCPSQQVLMANSTNASGAGGHAFTLPNITRTDRCGSGCAVIGWSASSATATSATFNKTASINMCTAGTSGCSETTGSSAVSSGTINLGANYDARSIFAITYGTIPVAPCPSTAIQYGCVATFDSGTNLVPFNSNQSVRVYNSSTTASATIINACASNQKLYPKGASVSWNCAPGTASGGAGGTTCNVPIGNWTDWECRNN